MDIISLHKVIEERLKLLNEPYQYSDKFYYLKKYLESHTFSTIDELAQLNPFDIAESFLCMDSDWPLDKILTINQDLREIGNSFSIDTLENIVSVGYHHYSNGHLDLLIEYFHDENPFNPKYANELDDFGLVKSLKENYQVRQLHPESAFELFKLDESIVVRYTSLLDNMSKIKKIQELLSENPHLIEVDFLKKHLTRNGWYKDYCDGLNDFKADIKRVDAFVRKEQIEGERFDKNRIKEAKSLEKALQMLDEGMNSEEITNTSDIVKMVRDPEIKKGFLEVIYHHNIKYQNQLVKEYVRLSEDDVNLYKTVLLDASIPVTQNDIMVLMRHPIEELSMMIQQLQVLNLSGPECLVVLKKSDLNTINKIKGYIDRGLFDTAFMSDHIDLFNPVCKGYQNFIYNISLLENEGINPTIFKNSLNTLLFSSDVFERGLMTIKEYGLISSLKSTAQFSFFLREDLEKDIDRILELGYEDILITNIGILNYQTLNRLELMRAMNIELDQDSFYEVLESNHFFLPDSNVDSYLLDLSLYKKEEEFDLSLLNSYQESSRLYQINGLLISRPKVLRNLSQGKSLYHAVMDHTYFSEEEYESITRSLSSKKAFS